MRIIMILILFGCFVACDGLKDNVSVGKVSSGSPKEITVFCAGSLHKPMLRVAGKYMKATPDVKILIEPAGSRVVIKKWTDLGRPVDLILVADSRLIIHEAMGEHTDWCLEFAGNEMVIGYTERSRHAAEISADNWFDILARPGVQVGRSDHNLDPCGYRALMLMQLADLYYSPDQRKGKSLSDTISANIPANNIRPKGQDLQGLLQTKHLDYTFEYLSFAVQHNLEYLELPDEINLGNPDFEENYARSSVKVTGKKKGEFLIYKGSAIIYGLTIPPTAPEKEATVKFAAFMLGAEGRKIFNEMGVPYYTRYRAIGKNVPKPLLEFAKPAEK